MEDIKGGLAGEDRVKDPFPVGMRVLAVDDDPTCLRLLDVLLRRCQYQGLVLLGFAFRLPCINLGLIYRKMDFLCNWFFPILCFC